MKKITMVTLFLISGIATSFEYGLHFDINGNIIKPDQYYLSLGLDDEKDGFRESAFKNFKKSAEYGNYWAMSLVGFYLMQDEDYVNALAWYQLVDMKKVPNAPMMEGIIKNIKSILTPEQLKEAGQIKSELAETYGSYPTLLRREKWKKKMRFTGTHLRGYIPMSLRIHLASGIVVNGFNVRKQIESFIYDYEFDFGQGEVTMDEIEYIDTEDEEE